MSKEMYSAEIVEKVINSMALLGEGFNPKPEDIDAIPDELCRSMLSAILAARTCKKIRTINEAVTDGKLSAEKAQELLEFIEKLAEQ